MSSEYSDKILYGKDSTLGVVGLEVSDGHVELFIRQEDGSVVSEIRSNRYWVLAHERPHHSWIRMKGDLHYKWGKQFSEREEFMKGRNFTKKYDNYSIWNPQESTMVNKGITYFKGMKPEDLSVLSFDLETTGLDPHAKDAKILLISNTFRSSSGELTRRLFCYDEFEDQREMLSEWSRWVNEMDPMILCGHNIFGFDLNYMIETAGDVLTIGRDGSTLVQDGRESYYRIDQSRGLSYKNVKCYGREIVDTMMLAYKYDAAKKKYDSYRLKYIIAKEGLEKEDRVMYDAGEIRHNYQDPVEWEKIKDYCRDDSDDALTLFELMSPSMFFLTQIVPKTFQSIIQGATGSAINSIMVRAYIQDQHSIPAASEASGYEGAISDGIPGVYRNAKKWDVASLYPSIILQYQIKDRVKDPKDYFIGLVEALTKRRLEHKTLAKETGSKYYSALEQSEKQLINSFYGFLGAPGLQFNAPYNAAEITRLGRAILDKAIKWATGKQLSEWRNPSEQSDSSEL